MHKAAPGKPGHCDGTIRRTDNWIPAFAGMTFELDSCVRGNEIQEKNTFFLINGTTERAPCVICVPLKKGKFIDNRSGVKFRLVFVSTKRFCSEKIFPALVPEGLKYLLYQPKT